MNRIRQSLVALVAWAVGAAAQPQVATFDADTGRVLIPSVSVGAATWTSVSLRHQGAFVFTVESATPQLPPGPGYASFDAATGRLRIPAVRVAGVTYLDVELADTGGLALALRGATELPAVTEQAVRDFAASLDASWANQVPAAGAERLQLTDACYRHDGRTREWLLADDAARGAENRRRDAYLVGRRTENIQVLALRKRGNADGSTRQEIDVEWDEAYADGTKALGVKNTLISGSSQGTPGCASAQDGPNLRMLGNQRLVRVGVEARNVADFSKSLGSSSLGFFLYHRREINWVIDDPMGNASYAIITGPGPTATVNGVVHPFSMKFISPRIRRTAPEFAGKVNNTLNIDDGAPWGYCQPGSALVPVVAIADCAGVGGGRASHWGVTVEGGHAAGDRRFVDQGWIEGGVYRFDIHADEGWKTINGHQGKTPVATYFATLRKLPYSLLDMAGPPGRFGLMTFELSTVLGFEASNSPRPVPVSWEWPRPRPDGAAFALEAGWYFQYGPKVGNARGAISPDFEGRAFVYPGSLATREAAWPITPRHPDQAWKFHYQLGLQFTDRNGRQVLNLDSLGCNQLTSSCM